MVTKDDDPEVLAEALAAVVSEQLPHRVILVDMSEGPGVRDVCAAMPGRVDRVDYRRSHGVSDSRNEVIRRAQTRYLLFLDADAIPVAGWANAMRQAFDRIAGVAVVGARCIPRWLGGNPPRLFRTQVAGDFLSLLDLGPDPLDVPRIIGTSYALDLERLPADPFALELGFGPGSTLAAEENAVCESALAEGWRVRYEPTAVVHHTIKPARASWPAMVRRAVRAGRETRRAGGRVAPMPRRLTAADRLFQATVAPAFVAGMIMGPPGRG
jgi:GT2 family glycosyltransferase